MTNTKRFAPVAIIGMIALLLAMVATMFAPANVQTAYAMDGTSYISVKIPKPIDDRDMTMAKYRDPVVLDTSTMLYGGTLKAEGEWKRENGWAATYFHPGIPYVYTLTITAEGFAPIVTRDKPDFELRVSDAPLKFGLGKLSSDGKTLTFVSKPYTYYMTSAIESLSVFRKTSSDVTLTAVVADRDNAEGVGIYCDGKFVKKVPCEAGGNPRIYTQLKVPYGGTHKVYARAYDEFGKWGKASSSINVSRDLIKTPRPAVTKISKNKVSIVVDKPSGATGLYVYANGKKIKTLTKSTNAFTYSKKNAAKKKYYVVVYKTEGGKVWPSPKSATLKPEANKKTGVSPSPSYYGYTLKNYLNMSGLKYTKKNSKGRLKATFTVTNTWKYVSTQTVKAKIKIKTASGKKVASQTFTVHGVKPWSKKKFTVYFNKAKTGMDIRTAKMDYSIKVVR